MVFLGLSLLTGLLFLSFAARAVAADLPTGAVTYLPVLQGELRAHWPDVPLPSALAAQVEQETCASLRSAKCWSPHAELRTSREYGFGLGQLTVTPRFDNFAEARKLDASLRDWQFADRYDPARQLRVLVLMDRAAFRALRSVPDGRERLAMAFSAYNGGLGGVLQDRRLCASVPGCDPARWFGHVELHSLKARAKQAGYGQSFYDINRGYVRNVMITRRARYVPYLGA
ncbi:MAG: lytic murein transglycosylase [Proteobacteria bacterium]|nr:lytic murein transglycosylase [Pseudomonadota bacterium]